MRLYHFSEDPAIEVFLPHVAKTASTAEPYVWAIDEHHAPSYWFPRDCPRVCCWTNAEVHEHPLLSSGAQRMHAIEITWLTNVRQCVLYAYEFDPAGFELKEKCAGYWTAAEPVTPVSVNPVGDLLDRHAQAGIELRIVPNLWPLRDAVVKSGLDFSLIRMRNARPA